MHGGSVRAHSEGVGRGAEITFCLPLEADAPETQSAPPAPSREAPLADRPLRVLVIEDNEDGAEMLRELLELRGHEVQVASCGPTGVEAAHRFLPDVVLCDIGLPGMDGYAVARALRSAPDTTSMKLIAVTGYGQESDRARSLEAGFDVHLTKPVHPDALARTLAGVRPR
jgi:CheY-like chemotaxis protein